MTRSEVKAWQRRWALVNARQDEELRNMSPEAKFEQLEALRASIDAFGWRDALAGEVEEVRARWSKLRKTHGKKS